MISDEQIDRVVKRLVVGMHPEKILLFGSCAEGNTTRDSDIDLLVVKDSDEPPHERHKRAMRCLRGVGVPVDVLVYTSDEVERWKDVETAFVTQVIKKGQVIYG